MTELPASLTPRTWQWNLAISLIVIGDLSAMLAAFMPMKAVLVLASNSVPGFFPGLLVQGGSVVAAIALILGALLFAGTAWLCTRAVSKLDTDTSRKKDDGVSLVYTKREEVVTATKERAYFASIVLTIPISLVLVLLSATYFALTVLWIASATFWIVGKVRRSSREPLYVSGADQFSHQLAQWLKSSALGAAVAVALVTLLIAPPALGSTAILIAAIFGRRLTLAISDIAPQTVTRAVDHAANKRVPLGARTIVINKPKGQTTRRPIDFLSSSVGRHELEKELRHLGVDSKHFHIFKPAATSPSLVSRDPAGHQLLIRIFSMDATSERDSEYQLRKSRRGRIFPQSSSIETARFCGFQAILVRLETPKTQVDLEARVSQHSTLEFQLRREFESLQDFNLVQTGPKMDRGLLVERLQSLSRIPGDHAKTSAALADRVTEIYSHLENLSTTLVPSVLPSHNNFYSSIDGTTCYLGGHSWTIGHMGDSWGPTHVWEPLVRSIADEMGLSATFPFEETLLNAEIHALNRSMQSYVFDSINHLLKRVTQRLDSLASQ